MDYTRWSQEYLEQAQLLKNKIRIIRRGPGPQTENTQRISILYAMYLDCLHTGRFLAARAEYRKQKERTHANKNTKL